MSQVGPNALNPYVRQPEILALEITKLHVFVIEAARVVVGEYGYVRTDCW